MPLDTLPLAVVVAGTGAGAVVDLRTRQVPNGLTLTLAGTGIVLAAVGVGRVNLAAAIAGGVLGLVLMLPGHLLGATGGGDVKLFAASGALLGPTATLWAFMFTLLAGGVLAVVVAVQREQLSLAFRRSFELVRTAGATAAEIEDARARNRFAYAPAIAIGAIIAAVFV